MVKNLFQGQYPQVPVEDQGETIVEDLFTHEFAMYAGEPSRPLRVIHEAVQIIDPSALENSLTAS